MPHTMQECINQLILTLTEMKVALNEVGNTDPVINTALIVQKNVEPPPPPPPPRSTEVEKKANFEELYELLKSDSWPEAVNKHLICDHTNPDEKLARGRGIIELMVGGSLKDLKFLDYGCGEGFSVIAANDKKTALSVGYDVKEAPNWTTTKENVLFTKEWRKVVENGPYDVILCFDVLDHCLVEQPIDIMKKIKEVLSPDGKVYLRTHPWTSRHANHFYHKINKAYIHLVFNEEELKRIDPTWGTHSQFEHNVGYTRPLMTYNGLIKDAGLETEHVREMKEEVEQFFSNPKIAPRIIEATKLGNFPTFQMSIQFVDMVLKHKKL